jgi:hypothetical protein
LATLVFSGCGYQPYDYYCHGDDESTSSKKMVLNFLPADVGAEMVIPGGRLDFFGSSTQATQTLSLAQLSGQVSGQELDVIDTETVCTCSDCIETRNAVHRSVQLAMNLVAGAVIQYLGESYQASYTPYPESQSYMNGYYGPEGTNYKVRLPMPTDFIPAKYNGPASFQWVLPEPKLKEPGYGWSFCKGEGATCLDLTGIRLKMLP